MDLQQMEGPGSVDPESSPGSAGSQKPQTAEWAERRKQTHLRCEKQRREAINNGYGELKELLPENMVPAGCKQTNASILFRTCDYLKQLEENNQSNEDKLKKKRAKLEGLQMIARQYESMLGDATSSASSPLSLQCQMLRALMETCFQTFANDIDVTDYETLTRTLITWANELDVNALPKVMADAAAASASSNQTRR
ncbi:hypothetical protein L596_030606 [Steinernema carpocapsae]|uniref:BHLH domain-containing protein n=1 Tax=Steinernema carpocapsae TaxID=34508 RepID=A0A4U5LPW4_STECR|nr:hypothetical protein L596_030606 [Steinernema carpocapsae]